MTGLPLIIARKGSAQQSAVQKAARERLPPDGQVVPVDLGRDAEGFQHLQYRSGAVALLSVQTVDSVKGRLSVAERRQHRADGEEVGCVAEVGFERFERRFAHADALVDLRYDRARLHEDVGDCEVGLEAVGIEAAHFSLSEDGTGGEKVRGSAPVALDREVGGLIMLSALDTEGNLGAAAPVLVLDHALVALHFGLEFDPEFAEDVLSDEHVRDALGL